VEERASLRASLETRSQNRQTFNSRIEDLNIQINQKRIKGLAVL
jgi:hypothetical protein